MLCAPMLTPVLALYILYSEVTDLVLTSSLQPYTYGSSCTQLPNIPLERLSPQTSPRVPYDLTPRSLFMTQSCIIFCQQLT